MKRSIGQRHLSSYGPSSVYQPVIEVRFENGRSIVPLKVGTKEEVKSQRVYDDHRKNPLNFLKDFQPVYLNMSFVWSSLLCSSVIVLSRGGGTAGGGWHLSLTGT